MLKRLLKVMFILSVILTVMFLLFLGYVWFFTTPLFDRISANTLNDYLTKEKWIEYKDSNLGISFMYPSSWKIPLADYWTTVQVTYICGFNDKSLIAVGDSAPNYIVLCKNPNRNQIDRGEEIYHLIKEQRNINNIKFTAYYSYPTEERDYRANHAGDYWFSENLNLLIVVTAHHVDDGALTRKAHDEIFLKILESIKPI